MVNIKLSLIIPCYNEEKRIGRCIRDLINQKDPPHEIIFIDGGSKDRTREIIKEHKKKNKLIKLLIESGKRSPANARNVGIKAATGNYFFFMDADSTFDENFIGIVKTNIMGEKSKKELVYYPSVIDSVRELFLKYLWYGRTIPKYLAKNKRDFKTILRIILSLGLVVLPFFVWNVYFLYILLLVISAIISIGLKTAIMSYKKSPDASFLLTMPIYMFFIFISTGIGIISIPFLYLTGKYGSGR